VLNESQSALLAQTTAAQINLCTVRLHIVKPGTRSHTRSIYTRSIRVQAFSSEVYFVMRLIYERTDMDGVAREWKRVSEVG
jgi:hypothetical protein